MWQTEDSSKAQVYFPLCPIISQSPARICLLCVVLSSPPASCLLFLWNLRPLPPSFLSKMAYKPYLPSASSGPILYGSTSVINFGLSYTFVMKFRLFSPVNLSPASLIISPARRTYKRWEENNFLHLTPISLQTGNYSPGFFTLAGGMYESPGYLGLVFHFAP